MSLNCCLLFNHKVSHRSEMLVIHIHLFEGGDEVSKNTKGWSRWYQGKSSIMSLSFCDRCSALIFAATKQNLIHSEELIENMFAWSPKQDGDIASLTHMNMKTFTKLLWTQTFRKHNKRKSSSNLLGIWVLKEINSFQHYKMSSSVK